MITSDCRSRCWLQLAVLLGTATFGSLPVEAAPPSLVFDLLGMATDNNVLERIYGSIGDGTQGLPVGGGFDCDGDGAADFAFGQILASPLGRAGAGHVTVIFGTGVIDGTIDSAGFTNDILKIIGDQTNEVAGVEIWIDDVTGDGLGDLLIGRQNYTPAAGREGAGALTLVVGGPELRTYAATLAYFDLRTPPVGIKTVTFLGVSAYDRLGIWVRTGDIDGDGVADMVVGADETDETGQPASDNSGAAYVIRGGPHLATAPDLVDLADFGQTSFPSAVRGQVARILPPPGSSGYHFGGTVQIGDLDGNGRGEVLFAAGLNRASASIKLSGAPAGTGEAVGGTTDGTLFIAWDENFPPCLWPPGYTFSVTNPPVGDFTRIDGATIDRSFAEEILAGRDYSGDKFPDLFVGDLAGDPPGRVTGGIGYVFYNAGNLRGRSFSLNSPPADVPFTTIYGPVANAIGADTAAQGDFDDDGCDDLAFGNPHDNPSSRTHAGSVHILYGQPGGWPDLIDLLADNSATNGVPGPDKMRVARIDGALGNSSGNAGDTLCYSAAAGFVDGDSHTDFIVNEMAGDGFGGSPVDVGNLLVISGSALLGPPNLSVSFSVTGPIDFGARVAGDGPTGARSIIISNTSLSSLDITSLALDGPQAGSFAITNDTGEVTLAAGATRTVEIVFDPMTIGCKGAALVVKNDADADRTGVGLSGIGMAAFDPNSVLPIDSFSQQDNQACLQFSGPLGFDCALQRSGDLVVWTPIQTGILGTGNLVPLVIPGIGGGGSVAFYKITGQPHPDDL